MSAAQAIKTGFARANSEFTFHCIPMADGGEGTVESLNDALGAEMQSVVVTGPLQEPVNASYAYHSIKKLAVIEMASASGLHHVPLNQRNPLVTTSYGTGELIKDALDKGAERIILGIGGSATNDGGAGVAQALGFKLQDKFGKTIGLGASALTNLFSIDSASAHPRLNQVQIDVACDVTNPLLGPTGASAIYGPQKGADLATVKQLDLILTRYATILETYFKVEIRNLPGSGAAGGLGAGLVAFFNAKLKSGIDLILEATQFETYLSQANLVITGEGRLDGQTINGKTPIGIAKLAKRYGIPVIAFAGQLGEGHQTIYDHGIDAAFSIVPGAVSLDEAFSNASKYLTDTAEQVAKIYSL